MITDEELKDWAGSIYAVGFKEVRRLIAEVKRLRAENAWVPVRDDSDDYAAPALPDLGEKHLLEREAREKAAVKRRRQLDDEETEEMITTFDYWGCKIRVPVENKK